MVNLSGFCYLQITYYYNCVQSQTGYRVVFLNTDIKGPKLCILWVYNGIVCITAVDIFSINSGLSRTK